MLGILNVVSDPPPPSSADVGARLRAAREARNLDLRDIAATTKISIGALEALEQNDFSLLPGGIFTRAFVRAYANEVGLDPEQTTRAFMAQAPVDVDSDAAGSIDRAQVPSARQMIETLVKLLVVGVPLVTLLFFGIRSMSIAPPGPGDTPAAAAPALAPPVERAGGAAAREPLAIVLRPGADGRVSLTVDGEPVVSRVMRAGEAVAYEAEDEIRLEVENAAAFDFTINDQTGRSLAGSGEVVITPENYRNYTETGP